MKRSVQVPTTKKDGYENKRVETDQSDTLQVEKSSPSSKPLSFEKTMAVAEVTQSDTLLAKNKNPSELDEIALDATMAARTGESGQDPRVKVLRLKEDALKDNTEDGDIDEATLVTREHPGRYERGEELGRGGIGRVVQARDRHLGRVVAIKELLVTGAVDGTRPVSGPSGSITPTPVEIRFADEARITGQLEHPGIVPVHELGRQEDGTLYYTMKMVRGESLAQSLQGKSLTERLGFLPNFLELCNAVAYAHSCGVVHRDLKPANVMLGEFGETILVDWGLAKVKGERDTKGKKLVRALNKLKSLSSNHTVAGMPMGTPSYMAPEGARGEVKAIDERSDIYSLGAILYELLTGRPPHTGATVWEVVESVKKEEPKPPSEVESGVPLELSDIAMSALAKTKDARYSDAKELAEDIRNFQAGDLVKAHRYTVWDLAVRWLRRRWPYLAAAVVLLTVAGGMWWYRGFAERRRELAVEQSRQRLVKAQVEQILSKAEGKNKATNWFDVLTFKLIALKEPLVEQLLISKLSHSDEWVRRLAARVLGGMKSHRAVTPLCRRLKEGIEPSPSVVVEVINALGIIGDSRAEIPVREARWRYGQHSYVWKSTVFAFKMIPLPPIPKEGLSADALTNRGRAAENKGSEDEGFLLYSRAIQKAPHLSRAYGNRGILYKKKGLYEEALADYNKAISLDPDHPAYYNNRGLIRKHIEDYKGALEDFTKVVENPKIRSIGLLNRAGVYSQLGHYEEALTDYRAALKLHPRKVSLHNNMSYAWRDMGRLQKALESCQRALDIDPKYIYGLTNKAAILLALGDPAGALATTKEALAVAPDHTTTLNIKAAIYAAVGNNEKALVALNRNIANHPDSASSYVKMAAFHHIPKKHYKAAMDALRRAVSLQKMAHIKTIYRIYQVFILTRQKRLGRAKKLILSFTTEGKKQWAQKALHYLQGQLAASALQDREGPASRQLCLRELVFGMKAELQGDIPRARLHYSRALDTQQFTQVSFVLARAAAEDLGVNVPQPKLKRSPTATVPRRVPSETPPLSSWTPGAPEPHNRQAEGHTEPGPLLQ